MARARSLVAFAAGVAVAAGLWIAGSGSAPIEVTIAEEVGAVAADLDNRLRETGAALASRAVTLAQLPRLAAAVVTDARTVEDLTQEELSFRLQAGETFELVQYRGDTAVSLKRMPGETPPTAAVEPPGRRVRVENGALVVAEVVDVMPVDNPEDLRGAVRVTRTVDLSDLAARLQKADTRARIEVEGASLPVGREGPPSGAETVTVPIAAPPGTVKLVASTSTPAPPPRDLGFTVGAGLALAAGLVAAVVLGRKKPVAALPSPGTDPTLLAQAAVRPVSGGGYAAITPGPAGHSGQSPRVPTGGTPAAGDWLGRYALVKRLGSGGMADVHLARATGEAGFEKLVALKVLHANLARRDDAVAYFLDEARLASRLIHPNIVQILDLGRAGDAYFIAMELIDGSDLDHVLRNARAGGRPVPVAVALTILRKMCDGLNAAHTAVADDGQPLAMVHRDVKGANVMVSREGIVKIADFGIVKANQQLHVTAVGQATGTPAVMAPEQRMGGTIDRRVDVYGVGAVAYEILTGHEVNLDLIALMPRGIDGWPHLPPPSQLRPELPHELDRLVLACLAFDADQRPASCAVVEHELEQIAVRYGWLASDKDVARWFNAELATMPPRSVTSRSDAVA